MKKKYSEVYMSLPLLIAVVGFVAGIAAGNAAAIGDSFNTVLAITIWVSTAISAVVAHWMAVVLLYLENMQPNSQNAKEDKPKEVIKRINHNASTQWVCTCDTVNNYTAKQCSGCKKTFKDFAKGY